MKESTPPRCVFPPKDFLDDSASMTSSTFTSRERFARKTDERSATHRSISRDSRERLAEVLDISRFYTKMGSRSDERPASPPRKGILNRAEEERSKKRSPTPLPGRPRRKEKGGEGLDELQADLAVCELQKRLSCEQEEKGVLAKRVLVFEREIKAKLLRIQELERNLAESLQRQGAASRKLQEYQALVVANENNLSEARNNLQRLKNSIKQNKYAQMESDNNRLKQQNCTLRQEVQRMAGEVQARTAELQQLSGEALALRRANEQLSGSQQLEEKRREIEILQRVILTSRGEKERVLEEAVERGSRENAQLRVRAEKLELRANFLNRKRSQELEAAREAKNDIIIKLKNKLSSAFAQIHALRAENEDLKVKARTARGSLPMPHRRNNFLEDGEDYFRLELSP